MEVGLMEAYFMLQQPRISSMFIYVFPLLTKHDMAEKPKNKSKQTADWCYDSICLCLSAASFMQKNVENFGKKDAMHYL